MLTIEFVKQIDETSEVTTSVPEEVTVADVTTKAEDVTTKDDIVTTPIETTTNFSEDSSLGGLDEGDGEDIFDLLKP